MKRIGKNILHHDLEFKKGDVSGSSTSTGSFGKLVGDGGDITNLPAAAISTYNTSGDNRVITSVNSTSVQGEANLTFDGSTLALTGDMTSTGDVSGSSTSTGSFGKIEAGVFSGSFHGQIGARFLFEQTTPSNTWQIVHNLGSKYPNITVFDNNDEVVLPTSVTATTSNEATLTFSAPISGVAQLGLGGGTTVSGRTFIFEQGSASTNWRVTHSLGERYPAVTVYDGDDLVLLPLEIKSIDHNHMELTFQNPTAGNGHFSVGNGLPGVNATNAGNFMRVSAGGTHIEYTTSTADVTGSFVVTGSIEVLGSGSVSGSSTSTSSFGAGFIDNKLGIGDSTPNAPLTILFTDNSTNASDNSSLVHNSGIYMNNQSTTNESYTGVGFRSNNVDGALALVYEGSDNVGRFSFNMEGSERFSINTSNQISGSSITTGSFGKMAIGTAEPLYANLNVDGDISLGSYGASMDRRIGLQRSDGAGWTNTPNISFSTDGGSDSSIKFSTIDSGVAGYPNIIVIDKAGNLLLGSNDTTADARLHISGIGSIGIVMNNASSGNNNQIQFQDGGNAKWNVGIDGSQDFGFYSYESSAYLLRINGGTKLATFAGDVTVAGTLTAQEFHTEFVSSSIVFTSGSTKFGDTTDDLHSMTGSLVVTGDNLTIDSVGGVSGSSTSTGSFGQMRSGPIKVTNNVTNNHGIEIDNNTAGYMIYASGQYGPNITQDTAGGRGLEVRRNNNSTESQPLVEFTSDHTATTQPTLKVVQDGAGYGLSLDQNGDKAALYIDTEATSEQAIFINSPTQTTGDVVRISDVNSLTTGRILFIESNSSTTNSRQLVKIINDNTAATGTVPLYIQQDAAQSGIFLDMNGSGYGIAVDMDGDGNGINVDNAGTGDGIKIDQNGNGIGLNIDTEATSAAGLNFSNPAQTTGNVILLDSANSLTTGRIAFLGSNSSDTSTRNLVEIVNEHASATGATSLRIRNDSTGTNIQVDGSGFALSGSYQSTGSFGRGGLKVGLEGPPQFQSNINGAGIDIAASSFPQLFFHNSTSGYTSSDGTRLVYEGHTLFFQGFEAAANFKFLTNNSDEVMSITGSDVGINKSKPTKLLAGLNPSLHVKGELLLEDSSNNSQFLGIGNARNSKHYIYSTGNIPLLFFTNSTQALEIDGSQNATFVANVSSSYVSSASFGSLKLAKYNGGIGVDSNTLFGQDAGKSITTGNENTIFGQLSGDAIGVGSGNTLMGQAAGGALTDGDNNVAIGASTMAQDDLGQGSVAIGAGALSSQNMASEQLTRNAGLGYQTGFYNVTGTKNTSVGYRAAFGSSGQSNSNNTAVGDSALTNVTTGGSNTAVGVSSLISNTIGQYNVAIGMNALQTDDVGNSSTAVGYAALNSQNSDSNNEVTYNVGVGVSAGYYNVTGQGNTYIGSQAGQGASNQSNSRNTSVGYYSLFKITTGVDNVALGASAGQEITTASGSVFLGKDAGGTNTTGNSNIGIGLGAMNGGTVTGDNNIAIGPQAMDAVTSGKDNIGIGHETLTRLTTGESNIAMGNNALGQNTLTGDYNVAIGFFALSDESSGNNNVGIGYTAGRDAVGVSGSVFIGENAGHSVSTGQQNIAIGKDTMNGAAITGKQNIGIGSEAVLDALTSGVLNIAIGAKAGSAINTGGYNTTVGFQAGLSLTTSSGSIAIGTSAMAVATTGNNNIAIGNAAANGGNTTGDNNISIGTTAGDALTSGKDNVFIGKQAGIDVNSGHSNVLIGLQAGHDLTTGFHNVAIGSLTLDECNDVDYAVCIGFGAGSSINSSDADSTVAIGNEALLSLTDGQRNVAVGYAALKTEDTGDNSTAVGYEALKVQNNNSAANTAVGMRAGLAVSSGYSNTLLGSGAGATLSTGYNNTYIGRDADGASGRINSVAIGHATTAQADNSVTLGNTDTTRIYTSENQCDASVYAGQVKLSLDGVGPSGGDFSGTGATVGLHISSSGVPYVKFTETNAASSGTADFEMYAANGAFVLYDVDDSAQVFNVNTSQVISGDFNDTSDIGLKENIVSISEGLSIINRLNPVTFDWKKKSKGTNSGFIAQEVEKILPDDVNGTDYDESLKDLPPSTVDNAGKSINLGGIVAHLTKAVQELSDKNEALEKRIAELESN